MSKEYHIDLNKQWAQLEDLTEIALPTGEVALSSGEMLDQTGYDALSTEDKTTYFSCGRGWIETGQGYHKGREATRTVYFPLLEDEVINRVLQRSNGFISHAYFERINQQRYKLAQTVGESILKMSFIGNLSEPHKMDKIVLARNNSGQLTPGHYSDSPYLMAAQDEKAAVSGGTIRYFPHNCLTRTQAASTMDFGYNTVDIETSVDDLRATGNEGRLSYLLIGEEEISKWLELYDDERHTYAQIYNRLAQHIGLEERPIKYRLPFMNGYHRRRIKRLIPDLPKKA